jgi:hypothetical protein
VKSVEGTSTACETFADKEEESTESKDSEEKPTDTEAEAEADADAETDTNTPETEAFKEESTDLNNAVQDALTKDIASQETEATEEKKECLVEEIDAEVEADEE